MKKTNDTENHDFMDDYSESIKVFITIKYI